MPVCSFCKKTYTTPRGLTVFQFDGKSVHFCSSKCRRNAALKRDPKKTNWVKRIKKEKVVAPSGVPSDTQEGTSEGKKLAEKVEKKVEEKKKEVPTGVSFEKGKKVEKNN